MNNRISITLLAIRLFAPLALPAQTVVPNQAAAAENTSTNPVQSELKKIMLGINAKADAKQGKVSAADFASDIQAFEDLLARHKGEKTDDLAQVALVKAMFYGKVLNDKSTAERLEKKLKVDFNGTKFVDRLKREEGGEEAEEEEQESLEIGLPFFPDFNVKDTSGRPLSVTRFKGKVVMVYFWASWFAGCEKELPEVLAAYKKYNVQGFEIIGINLDSDLSRMDDLLRKHGGAVWPQYFDGESWHSKLVRKYGVRNVPHAVVVSAEGDVIAKGLSGKAAIAVVESALKK